MRINPYQVKKDNQAIMDAFLTDDVLRLLAQNIDCRNTLAALCRVSKTFLHIFRPALYRCIWLDRYHSRTIASISCLPQDSHLKFTEDLYLGQRPWVDGVDRHEVDHDVELHSLGLALQKMTNLDSFTLASPLLCDFAEIVSENSDDSDDAEDEAKYTARRVDNRISLIERLTRCEKLGHLTLISVEGYDANEFTWRIPLFRNLRTLVLHGLGRSSFHGNADDIADVLLLSPELTSLGLSLKSEPGLDNDMLPKLISHYQLIRRALDRPPLRLSRLCLGPGFLPSASRIGIIGDDYLRELTDLAALTELRINNWNLNAYWTIPYWAIHPPLFARAIKLKKILVERLSPDIIELIELLKQPSSGIVYLDEIEVSRYFETVEPLQEAEEEEFFDTDCEGNPLYSLPLNQTGTHWRTVSYGTKLKNDKRNVALYLLQEFVAQCPDLEELAIPMSPDHVELFKSSIMPKAKRLHNLMITRGHIADLPLQISSVNRHKRLKTSHGDEHESKRIDFVTDIFALNRHLIRHNYDVAPLRYIGIGVHVYCIMLPFPGPSKPPISISVEYASANGSVTVEQYQTIKLRPDQARKFAAVNRLETEDSSFF